MKEITRIHIAKVAYDIELDAKKDIEQYMTGLEQYANDSDILDDIEIRVTELLAEHGVQAGGVIAASDVAAVRAQLGEPSDFASDGIEVEADSESKEPTEDEPRRVYRDESDGMVGGVLAGFAKFFGIDPLWLRLIFVIVLFASFGTAIIVYLVLWAIVPPARTAADRLRMTGQPVTLESIKELVKRDDKQDERKQAARRVTSVIGGMLLALIAIGGLLAIVAVVAGAGWTGYPALEADFGGESWWPMPMMGLFILSGLLFSALFFVLASAAFQRSWTKRISTAVISIIAAGLVVFASGVGMGMYGYASEQERIAGMNETYRIEQTAETKNIRSLIIDASDSAATQGNIEYIVSDSPRIELTGLPGVEPVIEVSDDGLVMTVKMTRFNEPKQYFWGYYSSPILKIYGPSLESIELSDMEQAVSYHNNMSQDALSVVGEAGSFRLTGTYKNVRVNSENTAAIALGDATIEQLEVRLSGGSVTAGVVRTLSVTQSDVCPARQYYDERVNLEVQAVSSGMLTYNGSEQPAASIEEECGTVVIGDNHEEEGEY